MIEVTRTAAGRLRRLRTGLVVAVVALVGASSASAAVNTRAYSVQGSTLLAFDLATPGTVSSTPITGLVAGDTLVGLAVRPQNGYLYRVGLGVAPATTARLYHVNQYTGVATSVAGVDIAFVDAAATPVPLTGPNFGVSFNPQVDRVRVVTSNGVNFRINPNTGQGVDGDLGGGAGSVVGVNPDGAINGATTGVDAVGYTNRVANTAVTTLYTMSAAQDAIFIQNPPNAGTQTSGTSVTLSGVPLNISAAAGLDFLPNVVAPASNAAATGVAHAILTVGGVNGLYTVNLATGAATLLGTVGTGSGSLRGFAMLTEAVEGGAPAIALTSGGTTLARFNTASPGTSTNVTVTGLVAGETLVGIGWRPATGQLMGFGVDAAANTGTVYRLDPQTAAATTIGVASSVVFSATDLPAGPYGFDVNPSNDRIRVVTNTGLNFRINPITGASIDGDALTAGTQPDGFLSGLSAGSTGLSAVAHTNVLGSTLATTLYTVDAVGGRLHIQNPPNAGIQTGALTVTLNGVPVAFTTRLGLDIRPRVDVATANAAATGSADALLTVSGVTSLYRLDLATGALTLSGALGGGTAIVDALAVGDSPQPVPLPPVDNPPPVGNPPPVDNNPPPVDNPPVLSAVSLTASTFRVGPRRPGTPKAPSGTTFRLTLSEAAVVMFTIQRRTSGRRVSGVCKPRTAANARRPVCVRYVAAGKLTKSLLAGAVKVAFSGKIGTRALVPGTYRVLVQAKDPAGQLSTTVTKVFTVIR